MADPYTKLRELLSKENFPLHYIVKFIGKNSAEFDHGVQEFEGAHPHLKKASRRESGGGAKHVALTYTFTAANPDEIVSVLIRVAEIRDVLVVL